MSKRRLLGERVAVRVAGCPTRDGVLVAGVKKETKFVQKFPVRFPNGDVRTYRGDQLLLRGTRAPISEYIRVGDIVYTKETLGVIRFIGNHEQFEGCIMVMESVDPKLPKDPDHPSFRKLFPSANLSDSHHYSILSGIQDILKILPPDAVLQQLSRIKDKYLAFVADARAKDARREQEDKAREEARKFASSDPLSGEEEARQQEDSDRSGAEETNDPEPATAPPPPKPDIIEDNRVVLTFGPGRLGIKAIWTTGHVEGVSPDGQAQKLGVKVGWRIHLIDGERYSEETLDSRTAGQEDYVLTFDTKSKPPDDKTKPNAPLKSLLTSETDKENYERKISELNEQIEDFQYTVESLQSKNAKLEEEHKEMTKLRVKVEHLRNSRVMFMSQIREMQKRVKEWKAKAEEFETKYNKLLEERQNPQHSEEPQESPRRNRNMSSRRRPSSGGGKKPMPKPDAANTLSLTNYQAVTTPKAGDGSSQMVSLSDLNKNKDAAPAADGPPPGSNPSPRKDKKGKDKKLKKKRSWFQKDKGGES